MDLETATDAVDAVFDHFGIPASYNDLNAVEPNCEIMRWRPSKERTFAGIQIDGYGVAESALYILVRAAEVSAPMPGQTFKVSPVGLTIYRIGESAPIKHDIHGIVWRCQAVVEQGA